MQSLGERMKSVKAITTSLFWQFSAIRQPGRGARRKKLSLPGHRKKK
jgi:hypothetical protein